MEPINLNGNYVNPEASSEKFNVYNNTPLAPDSLGTANSLETKVEQLVATYSKNENLTFASSPSNYNFPSVGQNQSNQISTSRKAKRKLKGGVFLTLIAVAVLLLVAATASLVWFYQDGQIQQQISSEKTVSAQTVETANGNLTAAVQAVNTANAELTANTQMQQATSKAETNATATAVAPATATARIWQPTVQSLDKQGKLLYQGSSALNMLYVNRFVVYSADINLQNFIASSSFQNPSNSSDHLWDYGFVFRSTNVDEELRVFVTYGGYWQYELVSGKNDKGTIVETVIANGRVDNLNTNESETNELKLYVKGEKGLFFLNGKLVSSLDLKSKMAAGDIEIGSGFLKTDEQDARTINYTDFAVYSLDDAS